MAIPYEGDDQRQQRRESTQAQDGREIAKDE